MALLEAMACGLPVVTTVRPDVLDWVDNQVGFVVDHDPSALTRAVIRILNDPSLAEKFGSAGKDMITTQFCWKSSTGTTDLSSKDIITRIEDVYQRTRRPCPLHQRNDEKV
jgi:glycosyltransferase involved in cell wall biosynthesis